MNVTAVMRLTRAVLPRVVLAGSGAIVNVSSEAGRRGGGADVAYTASRHAVIGLTRNTSVRYAAKGIRSNAVAPGAVTTNIEAPFTSALAGEAHGPILQSIVPPIATAEQLAAAITRLDSDDSANVTGTILASDGGWPAI
ncbi:SDR family oxidoreductase [Cryobacterium algoritolerans]|uniref:SDR family oxidoreductase n=1 Tax=Cryobacterium algoritolerans TaxID=1259184 RepID=UPI0030BA1017